MYKLFLLPALALLPILLTAQMERITETIPQNEAEAHLRFLAADELRGRNTGSVELNIAGRYIAEQFRKCGLTPLGDNADDYLQRVPLFNLQPPSMASVEIAGNTYTYGEDLAVLNRVPVDLSAPIVYIKDTHVGEREDALEPSASFAIM